MSDRLVRVGNAGGYWGDDLEALDRQLTGGSLDCVTLDFLAEITMSILQKQRARDPEAGYAGDFVDQMKRCLPLLSRSGTRLITNAGGINPSGCARRIARIAEELGLSCPLAVIEGDDLLSRLDELAQKGISLQNMDTGEPFDAIRDRVESANAYLGAGPVIEALKEGAQVVVTGRVTDTGITMAAPAFEFGWSADDWDRLACAAVAAHILECGAQATGGNLTDWREVPSFLHFGYPIAEFREDGSFFVTKHEGSGGVVNRKTVTSQLVYEMGDPRRYVTPDVIADFSDIQLEQAGPDRVQVTGARGSAPTDRLKVSISYGAGFKAHGTMLVSRPAAAEKAQAMADMFWKRLNIDFEQTATELIGHGAAHAHLATATDPPELLLRLGARDEERGKLEAFAKAFTALILNSVPGVAIVGARPRVQSVVAYWPTLIPAAEVTPRVTLLSSGRSLQIPWQAPPPSPEPAAGAPRPGKPEPGAGTRPATVSVPLLRLCYARSGDKGDTCNIGVVARSPAVYEWMRSELTARRVKEHFGPLCRGEAQRYEMPNLLALNFLLDQALGGGGTVSLRVDPQGKTLADALLMMVVGVPEEVLASVDEPDR